MAAKTDYNSYFTNTLITSLHASLMSNLQREGGGMRLLRTLSLKWNHGVKFMVKGFICCQ